MDSFLKIFRIQLFFKFLHMSMSLYAPLKFDICDIYNMFCAILMHYFREKFLCKFYTGRSFDYSRNNNLIMFLRNICFILENLFFFVIEPLSSEHHYSKYLQSCFMLFSNTDEHTFINFHFQPNFNFETTLVYRRWIDVILSTLFQGCFAKV